MIDALLQRRFIGQARLVRMLLWKVGETTDMDACLAAALESKMLSDDDAAFVSRCLVAEETSRATGEIGIDVTEDMVRLLQRMADKLNRADAA